MNKIKGASVFSWIILLGLIPVWSTGRASEPLPILQQGDVVTMYGADRQTYEAYGIDVLAWGGTPTPAKINQLDGGMFFGSVGLVTEFNRFCQFAGAKWQEGLCRDARGAPIKIPWLLDHQYKGIPYYFCCTNQPIFRAYIKSRIEQTLAQGAMGIHIDDHLGSAATIYHGGCYCDACLEKFNHYMENLSSDKLRALQAADWNPSIDYRDMVNGWARESNIRKTWSGRQPFKDAWEAFHLQAARAFMLELRQFIHSTKEQLIPVSANACLLFHPHTTDYEALDFFSAEIDQEAETGFLSDLPVVAYRLAAALDRPLAATASGSDWAHIVASGHDRLVVTWIAQAYASGQFFMTPHRQWCHTPQKGTHWYAGPQELFAPLYRFIKDHRSNLDGFRTVADVVVLFDLQLYRNTDRLKQLGKQLSQNGFNYQYAILGDSKLDIPLDVGLLRKADNLLIPEGTRIDATLDTLLTMLEASGSSVHRGLNALLENAEPVVAVENTDKQDRYRCFLRRRGNVYTLHVVNRRINSASEPITIKFNLKELELSGNESVQVIRYPERQTSEMALRQGKLELPNPGIWCLVEIVR